MRLLQLLRPLPLLCPRRRLPPPPPPPPPPLSLLLPPPLSLLLPPLLSPLLPLQQSLLELESR